MGKISRFNPSILNPCFKDEEGRAKIQICKEGHKFVWIPGKGCGICFKHKLNMHRILK